MKRKRNFLISGILIFFAGFFSHFSWIAYQESMSIGAMFLAAVFFMGGVIIFALNFRE